MSVSAHSAEAAPCRSPEVDSDLHILRQPPRAADRHIERPRTTGVARVMHSDRVPAWSTTRTAGSGDRLHGGKSRGTRAARHLPTHPSTGEPCGATSAQRTRSVVVVLSKLATSMESMNGWSGSPPAKTTSERWLVSPYTSGRYSFAADKTKPYLAHTRDHKPSDHGCVHTCAPPARTVCQERAPKR